MKQIKLTQGKTALVDDSDYEYLNQFKWYSSKKDNTFYAVRAMSRKLNNGKQKTIFMHREILLISNTDTQADHEDHNGLNNQRYNLRIATAAQNTFNRTAHKNSSSKYKGVSFINVKSKGKIYNYWRAMIGVGGKVFSIGNFKTEDQAALAYNKKAIELHGEFANLNKVS